MMATTRGPDLASGIVTTWLDSVSVADGFDHATVNLPSATIAFSGDVQPQARPLLLGTDVSSGNAFDFAIELNAGNAFAKTGSAADPVAIFDALPGSGSQSGGIDYGSGSTTAPNSGADFHGDNSIFADRTPRDPLIMIKDMIGLDMGY